MLSLTLNWQRPRDKQGKTQEDNSPKDSNPPELHFIFNIRNVSLCLEVCGEHIANVHRKKDFILQTGHVPRKKSFILGGLLGHPGLGARLAPINILCWEGAYSLGKGMSSQREQQQKKPDMGLAHRKGSWACANLVPSP